MEHIQILNLLVYLLPANCACIFFSYYIIHGYTCHCPNKTYEISIENKTNWKSYIAYLMVFMSSPCGCFSKCYMMDTLIMLNDFKYTRLRAVVQFDKSCGIWLLLGLKTLCSAL